MKNSQLPTPVWEALKSRRYTVIASPVGDTGISHEIVPANKAEPALLVVTYTDEQRPKAYVAAAGTAQWEPSTPQQLTKLVTGQTEPVNETN